MTDPTPDPTPLDLAALRVIAEVATEGPWRIYTVTDSGGRSAAVETAWAHDEQGEDTELVTDWCSPEDAAHIAAFDPPTALALLDRVEELESERGTWKSAADAETTEAWRTAAEQTRLERARAEAAEKSVAKVRELHAKTDVEVWGHGMEGPVSHIEWRCGHCESYEQEDVAYPCPTVRALDGEQCQECGGSGEVGRMTFEGGESDTCPNCHGIGYAGLEAGATP